MRQFRDIPLTPEIEEKMDARFEAETASGCWNWTDRVNNREYGVLSIHGAPFLAHRVSYTRHKGPIPDGLVLDHLCRNTRCINPEHLEAVTEQTNTLRGMSPGAIAQRREACKRGHLYSEYGRQYGPRRYCAACNAMHVAAYRERNRDS